MARPTKAQTKFRRLIDSVGRRELITPYLEAALIAKSRNVFPEKYQVIVHNKERQWDGYFHPSSHAYAPALWLYHEFLAHTDDPPPRAWEEEDEGPIDVLTMHIGSVYHAVMQSMFVHLGFTTLDEIEAGFLSKKRHCTGRLDVRNFWLPSGEAVPVEIKSSAYLPPNPFPEHVAQFQPYMDLGDDEPKMRGSIIYVRKGQPHDFKEFVIDRDEALLEDIYAKWRAVLQAVDARDPEGLADCPGCEPNNRIHLRCPARWACRMGPPKVGIK